MKFNNHKKHDNNDFYQNGKDLQRLEDQMIMQQLINKDHDRRLRFAGLGIITLSGLTYLCVSCIKELYQRIRKLEERNEPTEKNDEA